MYRGVESLCKLLTTHKRFVDLPTNECNCKVLDEKYRIAVQGIFVGIIIKAGGLR